jgi:hypothetical protein
MRIVQPGGRDKGISRRMRDAILFHRRLFGQIVRIRTAAGSGTLSLCSGRFSLVAAEDNKGRQQQRRSRGPAQRRSTDVGRDRVHRVHLPVFVASVKRRSRQRTAGEIRPTGFFTAFRLGGAVSRQGASVRTKSSSRHRSARSTSRELTCPFKKSLLIAAGGLASQRNTERGSAVKFVQSVT